MTDITSGGAGIYTEGLAVLPLAFELSFDSLRRKCRLVWRNGNFFGVAFENQITPTYSEVDGVIPGPTVSALNDQPQLTYLDVADGLLEYTSKVTDRKIERQANLHFTIGVVIALALPVLIGVCIYISTIAILRSS